MLHSILESVPPCGTLFHLCDPRPRSSACQELGLKSRTPCSAGRRPEFGASSIALSPNLDNSVPAGYLLKDQNLWHSVPIGGTAYKGAHGSGEAPLDARDYGSLTPVCRPSPMSRLIPLGPGVIPGPRESRSCSRTAGRIHQGGYVAGANNPDH